MRTMKDMKKRFAITAGCYSMISLSLIFLPLCGTGEAGWQKVLGIFVGILFWIGILSGSISYFLMCQKYKKKLLAELPKEKIPACLHFFRNPVAFAVDILLIAAFIGTIYCNIIIDTNRILEFISLFLFVTCFYLHFLVTGRVFQYIAKKRKGVRRNERKTQI